MRGLFLAFFAVGCVACLEFDAFETGGTGVGGGSTSQGGGGGSGPVTTTGGGTANVGGSGGATGSGGSGGSGSGGASPIVPCVTDQLNSASATGNLFEPLIEVGPMLPAPMITFGAGRVSINIDQGQAGGYRAKAAADLGGCFVSIEAFSLAKDALTYLAVRSFTNANFRVRVYLEPTTGNDVQACADVDGISLGCTAVPDATKILRIAPSGTDLLIEAIDGGMSVATFSTPRPNWIATGAIAFGVDATTRTGPDQLSEIESLGLTPP